MTSPGKRPRTYVHRSQDLTSLPCLHFRSGVSIHSHTHFSKESLSFIPHYASRIPWVAGCVRKACEEYRSKNGLDLDFSRAYWTPPVSPEAVWSSETRQIEDTLELPALVSITDHDTIDAPQSMQPTLPISLEWTVPWQNGFFHLGIHNIEAGREAAIAAELQRYTAGCSAYSASELLATLHSCRQTLIVFNHPLWDVERSGREVHRAAMQAFLGEYHEFIHAVEINGFRPWRENFEVLSLGEAWTKPVVAGGDRHGTVPNSVVNRSAADSIEGFVAEIREDRISDVLLMPGYGHSMLTRQLRTAGDAVQAYPDYLPQRQHWADRVYFEKHDQVLSLNQHWTAVPKWLAFVVMVLRGLGNSSLHRLMNGVTRSGPLAFPDPEPRRASSLPARGSFHVPPYTTFNEESGRQ